MTEEKDRQNKLDTSKETEEPSDLDSMLPEDLEDSGFLDDLEPSWEGRAGSGEDAGKEMKSSFEEAADELDLLDVLSEEDMKRGIEEDRERKDVPPAITVEEAAEAELAQPGEEQAEEAAPELGAEIPEGPEEISTTAGEREEETEAYSPEGLEQIEETGSEEEPPLFSEPEIRFDASAVSEQEAEEPAEDEQQVAAPSISEEDTAALEMLEKEIEEATEPEGVLAEQETPGEPEGERLAGEAEAADVAPAAEQREEAMEEPVEEIPEVAEEVSPEETPLSKERAEEVVKGAVEEVISRALNEDLVKRAIQENLKQIIDETFSEKFNEVMERTIREVAAKSIEDTVEKVVLDVAEKLVLKEIEKIKEGF